MTVFISYSRTCSSIAVMAGVAMLYAAAADTTTLFASAFSVPSSFGARTTSTARTTTQLDMSSNPFNSNDFLRWNDKSSRSAGAGDNVVELNRPLGLVLNQDEYGNVYVETVAPRGNAARTGKVKEGDIVTMCSATFGDEMWSTRGVGLSRVLAAIRVRSGATVKLVLESPSQTQKKAKVTEAQIKAREDARAAAQAKKDTLLAELEKDEEKLTGGKKFFGLF